MNRRLLTLLFIIFSVFTLGCISSSNNKAVEEYCSRVYYKQFDLAFLDESEIDLLDVGKLFSTVKQNPIFSNYYYIELHPNVKKATLVFPSGSKMRLQPDTIYQIPGFAYHFIDIIYERSSPLETVSAKNIDIEKKLKSGKLYELRVFEKDNKAVPEIKKFDFFSMKPSYEIILKNGKKIRLTSSQVNDLGFYPLEKYMDYNEKEDCSSPALVRHFCRPPSNTQSIEYWDFIVCEDYEKIHKPDVCLVSWEWVLKNLLHPDSF